MSVRDILMGAGAAGGKTAYIGIYAGPFVEDVFSLIAYTGTGANNSFIIPALTAETDYSSFAFYDNGSGTAFSMSPGTYQWTCPPGVTSVSVVCIGGGGATGSTFSGYGAGGGGGLGWKNNIAVVPGQKYTVVVGAGGQVGSTNGGDSYFINTSTVRGLGGSTGFGSAGGAGGTFTGDGGGNGGRGGNYSGSGFGGGGGAGGYTGNGGQGGDPQTSGGDGAGGGAGGAGGSNSSFGTRRGAGTGIFGQGTSGFGGVYSTTSGNSSQATGGSGGTIGQPVIVGSNDYGGSAGGGGGAAASTAASNGAHGAVGILWSKTAGGQPPQFPTTGFSRVFDTGNGMLWIKNRTTTAGHSLALSTYNNIGTALDTTSTAAAVTTNSNEILHLNSPCIIGTSSKVNSSGQYYIGYYFKQKSKFYKNFAWFRSGTPTVTTVTHNFGSIPGMIITKKHNGTGNWRVWHRSLDLNENLILNSSAPSNVDSTVFGTVTSSSVQLGTNTDVFDGVYAYIFGHDPGPKGLIDCGSATADANGNAIVELGWEPQWILLKTRDATDDWRVFDSLRGMAVDNVDAFIIPSSTAQETAADIVTPTPTGFSITSASFPNATYVYMAIRRPNKPPTVGTEVFSANVYTGNNADRRLVITDVTPDMVWIRERNDTTPLGMLVGDRLRYNSYIWTGSTNAELNDSDSLMSIPSLTSGNAFAQFNGVGVGNDATAKVNSDSTTNNHIIYGFKRAPGFFDIVCYKGTNVAMTVPHQLAVVPELIIAKSRGAAGIGRSEWFVYAYPLGAKVDLRLNTNAASAVTNAWNSTVPTANMFTVGGGDNTPNSDTIGYVAYLFGSLPGISKVSRYTGNGSSQNINCEFSAGARFVLIKRTDSTGDWYVWDTARGIVAANDPHLSLNSTAAEVTSNDSIDPDNNGFIVNQNATTNINVNGATYIFLAIA